ncbi:DUF1761 domain-containing protein [Aquimarina sp. AU474]|uniref:DUF1761 domain-containing protein n=1 Tax=Aquimarina sp. AU474 TaxID=2108529 RepID=UPI000D69932E|nr:DUF1761 domain-containing protein [Aquimarina sp. AU474]
MEFNFLIAAVAALIPMVLGFIWYNPKVFGTAWMNACGFTTEDLKGGNMPVIFILSYVFSFFLATMVNILVIHQFGFFSTLMNDPDLLKEGTETYQYAQDFMTNYGNNFRTFKHGVFHGALTGIFFVLPVLGTNALFERKGFKYIAVNVGYWTVCLALMGGVICQFA